MMTKQEAVLISAYTGFLLTKDFSDVHKLIEDVMGRPVWTHEIPSITDELREKLLPQILELIKGIK